MKALTLCLLLIATIGCDDLPYDYCTADNCYRNGFVIDNDGNYTGEGENE